jgi:hypothetical protein
VEARDLYSVAEGNEGGRFPSAAEEALHVEGQTPSALRTSSVVAVQPTMAPCARIMASVAALNSGK